MALKMQVSKSLRVLYKATSSLLFHCSLSVMQDAWDLVTLLEARLDARSLVAIRDEITLSLFSAVKDASIAFICRIICKPFIASLGTQPAYGHVEC